MFIDDLDRCLPEKALGVLESMKLFFDLEGFVFVVGLDQRMIERAVQLKYPMSPTEGSTTAETHIVEPSTSRRSSRCSSPPRGSTSRSSCSSRQSGDVVVGQPARDQAAGERLHHAHEDPRAQAAQRQLRPGRRPRVARRRRELELHVSSLEAAREIAQTVGRIRVAQHSGEPQASAQLREQLGELHSRLSSYSYVEGVNARDEVGELIAAYPAASIPDAQTPEYDEIAGRHREWVAAVGGGLPALTQRVADFRRRTATAATSAA